MTEALLLEDRPAGGVLHLTLNRPDKRNALNIVLRAMLSERLEAVSGSDTACVVLSGRGRIFSAGADLDDTARLSGKERLAAWDRLLAAAGGLPVPLVCAIEGGAYGGGLELALAADIVVAAEDATLALPEVRHGFIPGGGGTQRMARAIGPQRAMLAILTGAPMTGAAACDMGLVADTAPPGRAVPRALEIAGAIAERPAEAVGAARRAVRAAAETTLRDGLAAERSLLLPLAESQTLRTRAAAFVKGQKTHE